jgi:hypothetical protein
MFEALGRLRAEERPPYLLVSRSAHAGSELLQALAAGPPLFATTSFGDDLLLFDARWQVVDGGEEPSLEPARQAVAALERVDSLDVCDPVDEVAHRYSSSSRQGEVLLAGSVAIGPVPDVRGEAPACSQLIRAASRSVRSVPTGSWSWCCTRVRRARHAPRAAHQRWLFPRPGS